MKPFSTHSLKDIIVLCTDLVLTLANDDESKEITLRLKQIGMFNGLEFSITNIPFEALFGTGAPMLR